MARSASATFGGCCSACSSWFSCASLHVLLGLVSPPRVGRSSSQLLCCMCSSRSRALFSFGGALTVAGVCCGRCVCVPCVTPCLPLWLLGCPSLIWVALGALGTSAHVSKSAYQRCGQQKQSNDPCDNQYNPNTPTIGRRWRTNGTTYHIQHSPSTSTTVLRECGNDTSRSPSRNG